MTARAEGIAQAKPLKQQNPTKSKKKTQKPLIKQQKTNEKMKPWACMIVTTTGNTGTNKTENQKNNAITAKSAIQNIAKHKLKTAPTVSQKELFIQAGQAQ